MSRAQRQAASRRTGYTANDDTECEVEVEFDPGQPLIQYGESAQPGISAGPVVIAVAALDGTSRPDLIPEVQRMFDNDFQRTGEW